MTTRRKPPAEAQDSFSAATAPDNAATPEKRTDGRRTRSGAAPKTRSGKDANLHVLSGSGIEQPNTSAETEAVLIPPIGGIDSAVSSEPAPADGAICRRTDITPDQLFEALARLRRDAEAEIERLLIIIDAIDADECEADADDEPELGSVEAAGRRGFDQEHWADGRDGEPSLGAIEEHPAAHFGEGYNGRWRDGDCDQRAWASRDTDDLEDEHDGSEPNVDDEDGRDDEPDLGWPERMAQGPGTIGETSDREAAIGPIVTARQRERYRKARRGWVHPAGGQHPQGVGNVTLIGALTDDGRLIP